MERQPFIEEISKSFERGLVKTTNVKISFNIHKKQFEDIFNNMFYENKVFLKDSRDSKSVVDMPADCKFYIDKDTIKILKCRAKLV